MTIHDAFDNLYTAVRALILMDGSVPERLESGWVCVTPQFIQRDDIPESLREDLYRLQQKLAVLCPRDSLHKDDAPPTLSATEAADIASDLLELFIDVTLLIPEKPQTER
jgi:hypothetical protein